MKIISNTKRINRNVKITKYATFGSLIVLGVGIYFSLTQQDNPSTISISFGALLVGFILSQVSVSMQSKWGRSPRPDEQITTQLKGLDDRYTLYLYSSPVAYLLTGPTGIFGLIPFHQEGKISYVEGKWKQKGGNTFRKIFGGDGIGKPDVEQQYMVNEYYKGMKKLSGGQDIPVLTPVFVFLNPTVTLDAEDAPVHAIQLKKLKDTVRKKTSGEPVTQEVLEMLNETLS